MNFTYFVTFSLLMVLIVNNGQCASISAAQLVDDKANSSIVLNYRFVSDWEDFVLLNVNATETGPKQIESCSLSLQSQHGVNDKLYWSSAFDYAVIHSSRIESENKIVFNVLVKNVKPSPNYRFTASCRHLDGMMSVADDLDFELESVLPIDSMFAKRTVDIETSSLIIHNYQIDAAQPVDNKADSSIVLNYRYVEDWEDFVLLNVNATKTGPKQIESCSLSLQSQHDVKGKLYWSSAFDYAVIHSSRLESENKIVFSVLVKDVKPSPNYRITAVCKHSDGMLTMADNLDFKIHSTMSKARIMFAQPIHVEDSSSIVLNYKFDSILEDYISLTLNATETRSKIVKSCSLSVEKSADGKKHWTPTIDYSITDYSRPEFENKFIFNIQLKHLKPSPVYRFTVFCIHYDLSMTSSDNLDIDVDSIEY